VQRDLAIRANEARDLDDVLSAALDAVIEAAGLDSGGIYVTDRKNGALDLAHHRGLSEEFIGEVRHMGKEDPSAGLIYKGQPVYSLYNDVEHPGDDARAREGLRFIAIVPLRFQGETVGALNVASHSSDDIPGDSKRMIEVLAGQVGQAIARARLVADISESEERLKTVTAAAMDAIVMVDDQGLITFWNPAAERMFGFPPEEALGRGVAELMVSDRLKERFTEEQRILRETGRGPSVEKASEVEALRRDGTVFPAEVSVSTIMVDDRWHAVLLFRDITERKRAERELVESDKKYRSIFDTANDAIFVHDPKTGRITDVNKKMCEMYGCTPEEAVRMTVGDLSAQRLAYTQQDASRHIRQAVEEGPQLFEWLAKDVIGREFWVEVNLKLVELGGEEKLLAIVRDIGERKMAEEALRRINTELEEFTHTVSHDLRGPLAAAGTAIDLMKAMLERPLTGDTLVEANEALDIAASGVSRATTITEDLLKLARAGEPSAIHEPVDISEVVSSILQEKEGLLENRGMRVSLDDDLEVSGMDPTHAYQLFSNLIGNAIKHNDSESPEIHILRLGEAGPERLRYLVRDNGSGIPEGDEEDVFLPFHKGHDSKDTGIGLSIVDKVVRLYGGEVRAYNDNGACFEFTLPLYSSQGP
jgi:PAS domain S-box-containing protein